MTCRILSFVLLLACLRCYANDQSRAVQEELRRRNLYFGDIDGRSSPELQEALKHYQAKKGFTPTGQEDGETLRSLALRARAPGEAAPKELELPDEPVLRSDSRIQVSEEAAQIARDTGVAVSSIASGPAAFAHRSSRGHRSAEPSSGESTPRSGGHGSPVSAVRMGSRELQAFVSGYLAALGNRDLRTELRFYADSINYFSNGKLDRRIVERNIQAYRLHWPTRKYSLVGAVATHFVPQRGEFEVTYHVRFGLGGAHGKAKGETISRLVISAATLDPRIVSIEESRVRL